MYVSFVLFVIVSYFARFAFVKRSVFVSVSVCVRLKLSVQSKFLRPKQSGALLNKAHLQSICCRIMLFKRIFCCCCCWLIAKKDTFATSQIYRLLLKVFELDHMLVLSVSVEIRAETSIMWGDGKRNRNRKLYYWHFSRLAIRFRNV